MPALEITERDALIGARFRLAEARIDWDDGSSSRGFGRDRNAATATSKAVMEAIERSCYLRMPEHRIARADRLETFLHPDQLVRYADWQYGWTGFPLRRFEPSEDRRWARAEPVGGGTATWVAADFLCSPRAFPADERRGLLTHATTSGCASGRDLDEATLRATLELVERDAFMRHWFAQRPGRTVDLHSLERDLRDRFATLADAGCRTGLQCLDLGLHPTWLAWAQHPGRCFTSIGCASGLDAAAACEAALAELETAALARLQGVPPRPIAPSEVRGPEDHAALYATPPHFGDADALWPSAAEPVSIDSCVADANAETLYGRLEQHGHRLYRIELGDQATRFDHLGEPVRTVRALATGLIPMSFGHLQAPVGMDRWGRVDPHTIHPFS